MEMIRCLGCMEKIEDGQAACPYCGYQQDAPVKEVYYLLPGMVLHGKYIVGKVLGYGGFGVTYIGWDAQLERKVAIKEYLPSSFSTRSYGATQVTAFAGEKAEQFKIGLERFLKEAKRLAGVQQVPEIVQIYDCFMENDTGYIVMEYLKGQTLKEILKEEKVLPYERAKKIMLPVLKGLSKIHKQGIIHRDIAPDNIMLTEKGEIKILDFGAARYATSVQSRSLSVVLKPGYAPEEQYRTHGNQGSWTDVYAAGATLYRTLTGVIPEEALNRLTEDTLKTPSELGVKLPTNVENALMNSLMVKAEDRIQTADQLCGALADGTEVERLVASEKSDVSEKEGFSKKMKLLMAGSGGLVLLLMVLFATGVLSFSGKRLNNGAGTEVLAEGESYIPDISGLSYEEAEAELQKSSVWVEINGMNYSTAIEKNRILAQNPVGGSKVKEGDTVYVVMSGGQEEVMMPDLVGMNEKKAKALIEAQALELDKVEKEYSDVVAKGNVISQSIEANERIPLGTKICIVVSKGSISEETAEIAVPDLCNLTQEEAKTVLKDLKETAGFTFQLGEASHEYNEDVEKGRIISQSLEAGSIVRTDQEIELVISDGPELVVVPDVIYSQKSEAVSTLEGAGFEVTLSEDYSTQVASGNIISQSLEAGTEVAKGSAVKLVVSLGKAPVDNPAVNNPPPADTQPTQPSQPTQSETPPEESEDDDIIIIEEGDSEDDIGVVDEGDSWDDIVIIEEGN